MSQYSIQVVQLPEGNYRTDMVALPSDYGTPSYFRREDITRIRAAIFESLDALEKEVSFTTVMKGKTIIVKPNLVTVWHNMGLTETDYPETTDPRVLDSLIEWLSRYSSDIVIAESSGRGAPTQGSFFVSGIDRLASYRKCALVALEEQPVVRYLLPQAKVQKEIAIPLLFTKIVEGSAFYISVPKLKTNLYTGVTLGFKNAMGCLPYNLRQRNHSNHIERKLVEMLYLFKPDLTVIDGVVGGEGNCPAPVDPVDSRLIIAGNHAVETDRVATRLMGFDSEAIDLMRIADELGFADSNVTVHMSKGIKPIPFKKATPSLTSPDFQKRFPLVRVLLGNDAESPCHGGCVPSTRFAFEMLEREGISIKKPLTLILGSSKVGVWHDVKGASFTIKEILLLPGKKMSIGHCARAIEGHRILRVPGCMPFPNSQHVLLHKAIGTPCKVMGLRNENLFPLLSHSFKTYKKRVSLLKDGKRLDVALSSDNAIIEIEKLSTEQTKKNWIQTEFPPACKKEIKDAIWMERIALFSVVSGVPLFNLKIRLFWISSMLSALLILVLPVPLSFLFNRPFWGIAISASVILLHLFEMPVSFSVKKMNKYHPISIFILTFFFGFTFWVPVKKGVF